MRTSLRWVEAAVSEQLCISREPEGGDLSAARATTARRLFFPTDQEMRMATGSCALERAH